MYLQVPHRLRSHGESAHRPTHGGLAGDRLCLSQSLGATLEETLGVAIGEILGATLGDILGVTLGVTHGVSLGVNWKS